MSAVRLVLLAAFAFAGCAPARPAHTLHLRTLLGAADDGRYAVVELEHAPESEPGGRVLIVDAAGREQSATPLDPGLARERVRTVLDAGDAPRRVAPAGDPLPEGFAPVTTTLPGSDRPGEWSIEPAAGARGTLVVAIDEGLDGAPQLTASVRLDVPAPGVPLEGELLVRRVPWVDGSFLDGILPLPGGRVALLAWGSARTVGGSVFRVEDVSELRLGAAISALLDARAIAALEKKDFAAAKSDLELAVRADPLDATAHYNLACAYAQSGEEDNAILSLGEAVKLDPDRLVLHARNDPDLDPIRERVEFRLMIDPGPDEGRFR